MAINQYGGYTMKTDKKKANKAPRSGPLDPGGSRNWTRVMLTRRIQNERQYPNYPAPPPPAPPAPPPPPPAPPAIVPPPPPPTPPPVGHDYHTRDDLVPEPPTPEPHTPTCTPAPLLPSSTPLSDATNSPDRGRVSTSRSSKGKQPATFDVSPTPSPKATPTVLPNNLHEQRSLGSSSKRNRKSDQGVTNRSSPRKAKNVENNENIPQADTSRFIDFTGFFDPTRDGENDEERSYMQEPSPPPKKIVRHPIAPDVSENSSDGTLVSGSNRRPHSHSHRIILSPSPSHSDHEEARGNTDEDEENVADGIRRGPFTAEDTREWIRALLKLGSYAKGALRLKSNKRKSYQGIVDRMHPSASDILGSVEQLYQEHTSSAARRSSTLGKRRESGGRDDGFAKRARFADPE